MRHQRRLLPPMKFLRPRSRGGDIRPPHQAARPPLQPPLGGCCAAAAATRSPSSGPATPRNQRARRPRGPTVLTSPMHPRSRCGSRRCAIVGRRCRPLAPGLRCSRYGGKAITRRSGRFRSQPTGARTVGVPAAVGADAIVARTPLEDLPSRLLGELATVLLLALDAQGLALPLSRLIRA